jgi:dienelactone hydrolase
MIRFPTETLEDRAQRIGAHATVVQPDAATFGAGPHPCVIMMHGCGKHDGPQIDYAKAAAERGVGAIIVDSYTPRRISRAEAAGLVCSGLRLWGRERAGDIFAALHIARHLKWVNADRLSLAGWSHGGWCVMDALALGTQIGLHARISDLPQSILDGVNNAFVVYPWCGTGAQTPRRGWVKPVHAYMLLAEKDGVAGVQAPLAAMRAAAKSGAQIEHKVLAGATHCFDEDKTYNPAFRFDPAEAVRAHALYADWISSDLERAQR